MKAVVTIGNRWHRYRGCCFGLSAPTLAGFATVDATAGYDTARFNTLLERAVGGKAPDPPQGASDSSVALLAALLHWATVLQQRNHVVVPICFSILRVENYERELRIHFAIPYLDERCAIRTLARLAALLSELSASRDASKAALEADALLRDLHSEHKGYALRGVTLAHLCRIAYEKKLPVSRLSQDAVTIGTGINGARFWRSVSDRTSGVGLAVARDKYETAQLLRAAGLPTSEHRLLQGEADLLSAARAMGFPLVVKPADRDRGVGVFANITDEASLKTSYRSALAHSRRILLERHVPGSTHRVTVIDETVVKVTRKVPLGVFGDGQASVEALLGDLNGRTMQRRGRTPSDFIAINDELLALLAQEGLGLKSVLDRGRFLSLRRVSNSSRGGSTERLSTDALCSDNKALCIAACDALGLDIAGVDLICDDIGVSWRSSPMAICEVNGGPQLGGDAVASLIMGRIHNEGRIPIGILLYGSERRAEISATLRSVAKQYGYSDTSSEAGVEIAGLPWPGRFESDFDAATFAIQNSKSTSLLCALHEGELLREGLPVHVVERVLVLDGVGEAALARAGSYAGGVEMLAAQ